MFAVILDMDGVIVDNNPVHVEAWKNFMKEELDTEVTEEWVRSHFGGTNRIILRDFLGEEPSDEEIERLGHRKEEIYREIYEEKIKPAEGLMDFLESLEGIPKAVATSAPPENLEFVFDHLNLYGYFDFKITGDEVENPKPAPNIYLAVSKALNIPTKRCVVFEDSLTGVEAAKRAGMKVIGVTSSHSQEELGTEYAIRDFTEISKKELERLF